MAVESAASDALETRASADAIIDLPTARRIGVFALLLCNEFLYGWAWNTVDVLRPFLRNTYHLTLIQAGSLYSAQGAGALIGAIVLGQLADRLGRRNVLVTLVSGYSTMLLLGTFVRSYPELLAQRLFLGFFLGASFPVAVGIYVTLFHSRVRGRLAGTLNASFSFSIVMLGLAIGLTVKHDWRLLLWLGGLPPLLLAPVLHWLLPEQLNHTAEGHRQRRLPISELFHPKLRRQTLLLATMAGLNFFGYEAYSGWLTIYLTSVRHLSNVVSGRLVAWQFAGNIIGGFIWGMAADRYGRRFNAIGFLLASLAIVAFLLVPTQLALLRGIGFVYGACLCSSVIWGPWLAELYPPHLRSTAASIFNWGRVLSFFAPLVTAAIAGHFGLMTAMLVGSASFGVAAIIWIMQPETLRRRTAAERA